jgi:hypothetical protein
MVHVPYKAAPLSPAISPVRLSARAEPDAAPLSDWSLVISLLPPVAELDRRGLLSILQNIQSMIHSALDDSQAGPLAEFILTVFAEDRLNLGLHAIYTIYCLCRESASFIWALLDLEPIPLFLAQLQSSPEAKLVMNLLRILTLFHSIPDGTEICFELGVFSSVSQLFLVHLGADSDQVILHGCCDLFAQVDIQTCSDSIISQTCDIFCQILRHRADFLYWRVAEFVRNFIWAKADSGVNVLLEHRFGIELFTQLFDCPLDRFVLRSISSLLTVSTPACKDRLASLIDASITCVFERALLDVDADSQLPTDVIECFEKVCVINTISFELFNRQEVLAAFEYCLDNGDFKLRYAAAHCLFAALTVAGRDVSQSLFSRPVMTDALDVFECGGGARLMEMLRAVEQAITAIGRPAADRFWPEFEERFAGVVAALLDCEDETVRIVAGSIAADHFPDLLAGGD